MKIYTKTGDAGQTSLYSGGRVSKTDVRISVCGTLDEMNCHLGAALSARPAATASAQIPILQRRLFLVGADVATAPGGRKIERVGEAHVAEIERLIDEYNARLPVHRVFVLPGGSPCGAALHIARAVCRRAEREICEAVTDQAVNPLAATFLNRLSDWLYVLARTENIESGAGEVLL